MGVTNFFYVVTYSWFTNKMNYYKIHFTFVNSFSGKKIRLNLWTLVFFEQVGNYPHLGVCIIIHSLHTNPFYKKNINYIVLICIVMFEISQITIHATIADSLFKKIAQVIFLTIDDMQSNEHLLIRSGL